MIAIAVDKRDFSGPLSTSGAVKIPEGHQQIEDLENETNLQTADITKCKLCKLETRHAGQAARLHIEGISTGFISSLGIDFVTALYEAIIQSETSFGFVTKNDRVLGFVVFATNLGKLYKSIILKKGFRFAFILASKMFSLQRIKKVFETLFYPGRIKKMNLPTAELLSIVVAPEIRRLGLATQLILRGFKEYQNSKDKVKVLVAADNKAANKLYTKCGFELAGQIDNHGILSNIYTAETSWDGKSSPTQENRQLIIKLDEKPILIPAVT